MASLAGHRLIWSESISLLDHQQRSVRTLSLRQIRPMQEPPSTVVTHNTAQRSSIQGVFCEAYQLRDGPLRVDACVGALPGEFDAVAHDASGRELYRLELVEYPPGPVERALLRVPANYQLVASNPNATSGAMPVGSSPGGQP